MHTTPTRKKARLGLLIMAMFLCFQFSPAAAQTYCSPSVTGTSYYISFINFGVIGAGSTWNTGNNGYTATTGSSSKTIPRYYSGSSSFWYGITNTTGSAVNVYVQYFADWNHDGDFLDFSEAGTAALMNVAANSTTSTGMNVPPTLDAIAGATRIRIIVSQNSNITDPCAAVTGEVEDYVITVSNSTAPVLSASAVAVLNPLTTSQTTSEGFTINQLVTSSLPSATLVTDADDSPSYYVPRGVAIVGTTGSIGSWEYRIGNGSWTSVTGTSTSNALLLLGDGSDSRYQPATRLRFVPTGAGSASISFRAWDGTTGSNGTYASTTTNGGSTAFSSNTNSASITVNTGTPARKFFLGSSTADNIITSAYDPSGATTYSPSTIVSANTNLTNITDMDIDYTNSRLVWTESSTADKIVSADLNGSNVSVLYSFAASASIPAGIAVGAGKIFYTDNGTGYKGVYRAELNGTGNVAITGGSGQLATPNQLRDVEYYGGKLYVIIRAGATGNYSIMQMDTNGTNAVEVANSANVIQNLAVGANTLFWTEVVSSVGYLYSKPISGGSVTNLISASGRAYRDMIVDAANSLVYYLDYSSASNLPTDRALMSIPVSGGSATKLLSLPDTYLALASDVTATSLAITLTDFNGKARASGNLLNWTVAHEGKSARYSLERSANARDYMLVATVAGTQSHNYQFEDVNPLSGNSYYRLRMQDAEGEDSYSKTVVVNRSNATLASVSVYPNPVSGVMTVTGANPSSLILRNAVGQIVAGAEHTNRLNMQQLPAGCYYLEIYLEGSGEVVRQNITKE